MSVDVNVQVDLEGLGVLAEELHRHSRAQGFWEASSNFGEKIALIHSEASEALEEYRDGHALDEVYFVIDKQGQRKPEGVPIELADILIRVLDLAGYGNIDIDGAMKLKIEYNYTRPRLHGKLV